MLRSESRLGSAQARWNDYVGTAAADDASAVLNTRSLYEIAGLDRDRWRIVGIDFSMGSPTSQRVVVYGLDRAAEESSLEAVDRLAVTAFHLSPSVPLDRFLAEAFGEVSVRLVSSVVGGRELVVADHARPGEARE